MLPHSTLRALVHVLHWCTHIQVCTLQHMHQCAVCAAGQHTRVHATHGHAALLHVHVVYSTKLCGQVCASAAPLHALVYMLNVVPSIVSHCSK